MVKSPRSEVRVSASSDRGYPDNPVLVRVWRGGAVESQHRGAWALANASGEILEGAGEWEKPVFVRSSVKCLQALPLLESGAAERFGLRDSEVALALSSHNAEACHTEGVAGLLARIGLSVANLRCGAQPPGDPEARCRLREAGAEPTALHNNCSGKHAGFLTLALHLGESPERYLDPEGQVQTLVREAVRSMTGVAAEQLSSAVDGCSAPTFRLPLSGLATAFARVANPERLPARRREACERMLTSVAGHPELIAGRHQRICTDIARVTRGRIFPKIGGDAVYGLGLRGEDRGIAIKIDDGAGRGLHAVIIALLRRFGFANEAELVALAVWEGRELRNWSGIQVGRTEVLV
jgi:L-asparaginase II